MAKNTLVVIYLVRMQKNMSAKRESQNVFVKMEVVPVRKISKHEAMEIGFNDVSFSYDCA